MKKIIMVFMMVFTMMAGLVSCATTSSVNKGAKIKEEKLTRLSYVKKICQITDVYESEDLVAYELYSGKGRFVNDKKGRVKVCLIVKDGELYGRYSQSSKEGAVLAQSYHSDVSSSVPSYQNGYIYFYTPDRHTNNIICGEMNKLARKWGLID